MRIECRGRTRNTLHLSRRLWGAEPAHVGQASTRVPANRNQLCRDGNRNLLRGDGADVESDGRVNPVKQMRRHAFLLQRLEDLDHLALGADHADIAGASLHRPAQHAHVVAVTASDNNDVGGLVRLERAGGFVEVERMHFASRRKAFLSGVGGSIVGNDEVKARISGNLAKVYRYMTCTKNIK